MEKTIRRVSWDIKEAHDGIFLVASFYQGTMQSTKETFDIQLNEGLTEDNIKSAKTFLINRYKIHLHKQKQIKGFKETILLPEEIEV